MYTSLIKKLLKLFWGFIVVAFGIVFMLNSNLGLSPWDTFQKGISDITFFSFGQATQLVGLTMIFIGYVLKVKPGLATIFNMYFVGLFIDIIVDKKIIPLPSNMSISLLYLAVGLILLNYGIYLYISSGLGAGPRDGFMLGIIKKYEVNTMVAKTSIEVTILIIGILLGGPFGIGTIIITLSNGFILHLVFSLLKYDPSKQDHLDFKDLIPILTRYK